MKGIFTIMLKEIRDNLRDKRSLFFALVYGPLLMPALMMGPLVLNAGKHFEEYDSGRELHVYGAEYAPNLLEYLRSKNMDAKPVGDNFVQRIKDSDLKLVVEITENYGDNFNQGKPAKVIIHYDTENQQSQSYFWQVRAELDSYGRTIAAQRMSVRGFDQSVLRPLDIAENDLSEEEMRSGIIANILMFLVIFSSMMGGFYLAIDITAGERERLSLEPLLSLPLSRMQVALGKYLAILAFCVASFILPIVSVAIWAMFLPDKFFGIADIPNAVTYLKIALLSFPLCIMMTGFLMVVAAWAKSNKEAQTQLGIAMLFPMAPFFMVQFMNIKSTAVNNMIPFMGQYLLADKIMFDSAYPVVALFPSMLSSFILAVILLGVAIHLYHKDSILGT